MTLIATHTATNFATVVTDSMWYSPSAERIGYTSKVATIPHLAMAVTGTGTSSFLGAWAAAARMGASQVRSFDEFVQAAPAGLRLGPVESDMDTLVIHVGYSDLNGRFMAYGHPSWHDFETVDLGTFFAHPMPFQHAPHPLELERLSHEEETRRLTLEWYPETTDDEMDAYMAGRAENYALLAAQPAATSPKGTRGWVRLAKDARESRAMARPMSGVKTLVGGQVWKTTLTRQSAVQELIHEFDDVADAARLFAGTLHPSAADSAA